MTREKGLLPVGQIKLGMHVRQADGSYGVVTGWKVVPGTQVMYNLEVAQDHTFTVGDGQWVVHNCGGKREVDLGGVNSYEQARNKAMDISGDLGPDSKPYIGRLHAGESLITGRSSADSEARWRLDYDPIKGPHIHVEDFRYSKSGGLKGYIQFPGDGSTVISLLLCRPR